MKLTLKSIYAILGIPFFFLGFLANFIWLNLEGGFYAGKMIHDMIYDKMFK